MKLNWVGIDYGSQKAGTTVIAYCENKTLKFLQSIKGKSADDFIINQIEDKFPFIGSVYLDAPLSLPLAYYEKGTDFMYRKADRALSAMSPMFLGGLTARAMSLAAQLDKNGIPSYETYPSKVEEVELGKTTPKKEKIQTAQIIELLADIGVTLSECSNRHQYDAFWAWWAGFRDNEGRSIKFGDSEEGVIII